jgi:signal transduction histidine kinase
MPASSLHPRETDRLESLRSLSILDTPPEESFDIVTRLVSELLHVPIVAVSLVDESRQWLKSCVGLEFKETDRASAFCSHAILGDIPLLVEDATKDPRFVDNPLVTGPSHIRFYLGVPLKIQEGLPIGTLCAIDPEPRSVTEKQVQIMRDLAVLIQDQLALRLAVKKQLESQFKAVRAEKFASIGTLAAGVAHEINTPMQFVGNNCEFMASSFSTLTSTFDALMDLPFEHGASGAKLGDSERVQKILEEADLAFLFNEIPLAIKQSKEGIERITTLVTAMRDFSHSPQGGKRMEQINKSIETTLVLTRNSWKYISEINLCVAPDLPLVECNLGEINQVVLNLIVNAVDAVSERKAAGWDGQGLIQIRTFQSDSNVVLEVQDNGTGIPQKVMPKIFDPFFTTKAVGKGTGQGLAISYDIVVRRHHGSFEVQSTAGEQKTVFTVSLPITAPAEVEFQGT